MNVFTIAEKNVDNCKLYEQIISRKPGKGSEDMTALIALFGENDPHLSGAAPVEILEFESTKKRLHKNEGVSYMV